VLGGDVKLSPVSVIHGDLSIEVVTSYAVAPVPYGVGPYGMAPGGPAPYPGDPYGAGPQGGNVPNNPAANGQAAGAAVSDRAHGGGGNGQGAGNGGNSGQQGGGSGNGGRGAPGNGGAGGPGYGGPGAAGLSPYGNPAALVPETSVNVIDQPAKSMKLDDGANVQELVNGLHAIGATAHDVVSILQAIKAAGGIQADLEVQ